ncbi:hypothetical protein FRC03_004286 [Tulasnella sp. 419]|nr:hypothetical protein FRC03_004286 [Tulasnella sp. 419]
MAITPAHNPLKTATAFPYGNNSTFYPVLGNPGSDSPMSCGNFTIEKGKATAIVQPADTFNLVLEGEMELEDLDKPGEVVTLRTGDMVRMDKGTTFKWSTQSVCKGFYVVQIPLGPNDTQPIDI